MSEGANDCAERREYGCVCDCVLSVALNCVSVKQTCPYRLVVYKNHLIFHAISSTPVIIK